MIHSRHKLKEELEQLCAEWQQHTSAMEGRPEQEFQALQGLAYVLFKVRMLLRGAGPTRRSTLRLARNLELHFAEEDYESSYADGAIYGVRLLKLRLLFV